MLDTFHKVVGSLIVLPAPLTVKALAAIIDDEGTINPILQFLHSVFFIPSTSDEKVQMRHLSFRDYLINPPAKDNPFRVDEKNAHRGLGHGCIAIMGKGL